MTKKILIINGPNLNLLGEREESKYGKVTLEEVKKNCESRAKSIGVEIKFDQSNVEGEIVTMIQKAKNVFDGIIINAAGYTHTSVAILDALLAIKLPTIEVHITNIYNREEFRKKSLISKAAKGIICGFGVNGYIMALDSMKEIINRTNLNELLNKLKIKNNKVAIEVNGEIIEKNKYPNLILNKEDKVEIVHFIGGG